MSSGFAQSRLVHSAPHGFAELGYARFALAFVLTIALPSLGAASLATALTALGAAGWGDGWAMALVFLWLIAYSFFVTAPGLLLASLAVAVMMNRGWFGLIPALGTGIVTGQVLGLMMDNELAVTFGAALLVILRAVIGRLAPRVLQPGSEAG